MGPYSMLNISGTYKGDLLLQSHTVEVFLVLLKYHFLQPFDTNKAPFVVFSSKFLHGYCFRPIGYMLISHVVM